jgi:alpha-galactosidase
MNIKPPIRIMKLTIRKTALISFSALWLMAQGVIPATAQDAAASNSKEPLKVFILAGQSNMQGHAQISTFDTMRLNPVTAPILEEMVTADGTPRVCEQVWISSIGSADEEKVGKLTAGYGAEARGPKIGPEFTFGIYMEKALQEPILIIKTAWGGKSLNTDFRSPGSGPYPFSEQQLERAEDVEKLKADKAEATGLYYRLMIEHVKKVLTDIKRVYPDYDPDEGYEIAGFVWFQGWNDMVDQGTYPDRGGPEGYADYSTLMAQFIRDVRKDLSAPDLPFVIGVLGVGGPVDEYTPEQQRYSVIHQNFRDAMAAPAALPEFKDNVRAVLTEKYWDREVVELRNREKTIKPQVDEINNEIKEERMDREDGRAAIEKLYEETFSPQELEVLRESTSNFEFHYLGSARIMSRIGKAFAEAMIDLISP